MFLISNAQHLQSYETSLSEVQEREKKVKILEDLFNQGAESEVRLIDEKLTLIDAHRRLNNATIALNYSQIQS